MINSKLALVGFSIEVAKRQIIELETQIEAIREVVIALEDSYGELKFELLEKELNK